jgi:imidazolonepropionase-like amidohydrolase
MSALLSTLLLSTVVSAQAAPCTVFTGGTVALPQQARDDLEVLVADGIIQHVAPTVDRSWQGGDCQIVALEPGAWLTPGLVHVGGTLGLQEVWGEPGTHKHDAGGEPVRAAHDVADSYDPNSVAVPVARREGITGAVVVPGGGMVAGQAAFVQLEGVTQAEAVVQRGVAMRASLSGGSPAEGLRLLRELLDDARAYAADRRGYDQNRSRGLTAGRMELEALQPVLDGRMPLLVGANRSADIEALIRFAQSEQIELIIEGGAEAWLHADALAQAGIPVIINPLGQDPSSFDQLHARHDNPALLAEAGVRVMITNHSALFAGHLRQLAGLCVREGMPHTQALAAITTTPAAVFGLEDRGRIAHGAQADLVIWNGDPLELSSWPTTVLIGGEPVDLRTRHDALFERYRELPGLPLPGLPLPAVAPQE